MTRYVPNWVAQGVYSASQDRFAIAMEGPNAGVLGMVVTPQGGNMTLLIATGTATVPTQNSTGSTLCVSDAVEAVTISSAPPAGQSRIDIVTVHPRANDIDGGSNNDFIFDVLVGTPATTGGQLPPAIPAGQIPLANILVGLTVTAIVAGNITDQRAYGIGAVQPMARLWRNAAYTNVNTATTRCPFDRVLYDNTGGRAVTAAPGPGFVCPKPGFYQVNGAWTRNATLSAGHAMQVLIQQNGTSTSRGGYAQWTANGASMTSVVTDIIQCATGDVLTLAYIDYGGGGANTLVTDCFMSIACVGQ